MNEAAPHLRQGFGGQDNSCPRCRTPKARKRLGAEWCCWELAQLATLIAQGASMREVAGVLAGRSEKSIDATCRRYGLKVPQREREPRRKRCPACSDLFAGGGKICARCLRPPAFAEASAGAST